jgi:hypothetical protein
MLCICMHAQLGAQVAVAGSYVAEGGASQQMETQRDAFAAGSMAVTSPGKFSLTVSNTGTGEAGLQRMCSACPCMMHADNRAAMLLENTHGRTYQCANACRLPMD